MNLRERQSSRKYILPPIPSSPLGNRSTTRANTNSANPLYGETRESTLRPGVRFRKTASSLRIIATKGNATLTAGLTYPKIHNPDLELYQKLKKREHEFAEAIVPAGAPFQYIPSPARDAELSAASARLYRPQTAAPNANAVDTKFDTFGNWYQDMKLKVHMRVVQSQQIITENNPLEEQIETPPSSVSPKSKKDKKKKDSYDAIEPPHHQQMVMTPKSKETKKERKMSLLSMKDILPSARDKNRKSAQAWEASRESWFAESTPHQSAPSTPKNRLTRASSFGSQSATPHTYIPSSPADSPLRPRSRTHAPPRVINATPVNTSSAASSMVSSSASSMASSVSTSPLYPSPTSATTPTHRSHTHIPQMMYASNSNLPTATVTHTSPTTPPQQPTNQQLTQPVFLSRGKKVHSEYDIRKIRFKARNSVGLEGIGE